MEVLKKTDPTEWKHEQNCKTCESTLLMVHTDLTHVPGGGDQRDSWEGYFTFVCPVCKSTDSLKLSAVPTKYHHAIRNER